MADPYSDLFQVKFVEADHPVVQGTLAMVRDYPFSMAARLGFTWLGKTGVAGVLLYPTSLLETAS